MKLPKTGKKAAALFGVGVAATGVAGHLGVKKYNKNKMDRRIKKVAKWEKDNPNSDNYPDSYFKKKKKSS